jgi:hypothetical protein
VGLEGPSLSHLATARRRPASRPKREEPRLAIVDAPERPRGSCETFVSATGVIANFCASAAVDSSKPSIAVIHTRREHRKASEERIILPHPSF